MAGLIWGVKSRQIRDCPPQPGAKTGAFQDEAERFDAKEAAERGVLQNAGWYRSRPNEQDVWTRYEDRYIGRDPKKQEPERLG